MTRSRLLRALGVLLFAAVAATLAIPALRELGERRKGSNEVAAIGALHGYQTAQILHFNATGRFARSLRELVPHALDPAMAAAEVRREGTPIPWRGYLFSEPMRPMGIVAFPAEPGVTGDRAFFTDESGVVRFAVVRAGEKVLPDPEPPPPPPPEIPEADRRALERGGLALALGLHRSLGAGGGNAVVSPHGVSVALATVAAGARGETAIELERALGLDLPAARRDAAFEALTAGLRSAVHGGPRGSPESSVSLAVGLFRGKEWTLAPGYEEGLGRRYGAEVLEVDFAGDRVGAAGIANAWALRKTRGRIAHALDPAAIHPQTAVFCANVVAFDGVWETPFERSATQPEKFTLPSGEKVEVPLMFQGADMGYAETAELQILRMPYRGSSLALTLLLPRRPDGLPALEAALSAGALDSWRRSLAETFVATYVPRFSLASDHDLRGALRALGVARVFDRARADLSGMIASGPGGVARAWLAAIGQRATIDVDEEGTTALAFANWNAIGGDGDPIPEPKPNPVFRADHPFLFLVEDVKTGAILFLGRVADPRAKA